jgi:hypothetical protein
LRSLDVTGQLQSLVGFLSFKRFRWNSLSCSPPGHTGAIVPLMCMARDDYILLKALAGGCMQTQCELPELLIDETNV